jgi:hypothetical protein
MDGIQTAYRLESDAKRALQDIVDNLHTLCLIQHHVEKALFDLADKYGNITNDSIYQVFNESTKLFKKNIRDELISVSKLFDSCKKVWQTHHDVYQSLESYYKMIEMHEYFDYAIDLSRDVYNY